MRVTAAFNRLLGFCGTVVEKVVFGGAEIMITVRLRSRRLRCPIYREAAGTHLPHAAICYDPFHLIKWAWEALVQVHLARRIRHHFEGIIAAIRHQLSNSLIEGINAGIRLIQRRANGYASLDNLIEMIHLCHGGVPTRLPNRP